MICPKELSDRGHRTFSGGEAFRGGPTLAGFFGLSADSTFVAQKRAVKATRERNNNNSNNNRRKKEQRGEERQKREGKTKKKGWGLVSVADICLAVDLGRHDSVTAKPRKGERKGIMTSHTIGSNQSMCQLGGTCLLSKRSFLEDAKQKKRGAIEGTPPG